MDNHWVMIESKIDGKSIITHYKYIHYHLT